MKYKLFALTTIILLSFCACKKCATCTRKWNTTTKYVNSQGNTVGNVVTSAGPEETFEVCGSNDIKNAENQIISRSETPGNNTLVVESVGNCTCITN